MASQKCEKVVSESWGGSLPTEGDTCIFSNLEICKQQLKSWSRTTFRRDKKHIAKLENRLQAIQSGILSPDLIKEASDIREELEKLAAHEETFWKQRGKALWLKEGDRNTTFFHKRASHRFRTNLISKLKNSTGAWVYEEKEIQHCIVSYFQNLFSSNNPNEDDIARGTENLRRVVDTSMEEDLLRPYSEDEVTKALFQMAPLKSPGPDDMPPIFFQKFW
ncbi:UNVERIFIED_CONTAM: hypothetical protein Scaly_1426400 [Sesamum calycinum]|uniref:Reverse transcriptase n=1 Tax=Sesamum calycinum TaxID=2727403 RepID=A0AAW2PMD0_9LAMI